VGCNISPYTKRIPTFCLIDINYGNLCDDYPNCGAHRLDRVVCRYRMLVPISKTGSRESGMGSLREKHFDRRRVTTVHNNDDDLTHRSWAKLA